MFGLLSRLKSALLSLLNGFVTPAQQSPSSPSLPSSLDSDRFTQTFWRAISHQLKRDEGYDNKPYNDSEGWLTIGIGHLIDPRKGAELKGADADELAANGKLSDATIERIFVSDVTDKDEELRRRAPWVNGLDKARYGCLLNMAFQMGVGSSTTGKGLLGFKNTLNMVKNGDYERAAEGMKSSLWYKQTPNRAKRVSEQMRTGKWN